MIGNIQKCNASPDMEQTDRPTHSNSVKLANLGPHTQDVPLTYSTHKSKSTNRPKNS